MVVNNGGSDGYRSCFIYGDTYFELLLKGYVDKFFYSHFTNT